MYQLNPALQDFWREEARHKILHGGRASSKSHDAAGMAVYLAANYTIKVLCARQFQNRISESVYVLLKEKILSTGYANEFYITKNSILHKRTGSEFLFYGIARNLEEIKSTEGVDILWLEEAHYLTKDQWEVIYPTIRKQGSQIWIIFNPDEYMDWSYQNFVVNPPADSIVRQINWQENPFMSDTMLKVIYDAYRRDRKGAEHIYGGMPKMGGDKSIINLQYIMAAIDAHKKIGWEPSGNLTLGYDVADDGDDTNAAVLNYGNVIMDAFEWEGLEDQLTESCKKVYNYAMQAGASITYDSIGVGAFVGSKLRELNEERNLAIDYDAFNAGGRVDDPDGAFMVLPHKDILNKDHFSNIKAQKWTAVGDRFRKTYEVLTYGANHPVDELISINSATVPKEMILKLQQELSTPRKDHDLMGKFKVESKKDLVKRGIKSPNVGDAAIMSLVAPTRDPKGFFD